MWSLGMMVLEGWRSICLQLGHEPGGWWTAFLIYWIFAGTGVLIAGTVRFVAGKIKAGAPVGPLTRGPIAPATQKEE
jgi:hypothetical protein